MDDLLDAFGALPPVSLAELEAEAAFLTRRDRKYLLPVSAAGALLTSLPSGIHALEIDGRRSFGYLSPYFDDHRFSAYHLAARRRRQRFKVRTRQYTDSGVRFLEVKVRDGRGRTVKLRRPHVHDCLSCLDQSELAWLRGIPQVAPFADGLRHCLTTSYRRSTLVLPRSAGRVTIDRDLRFSLPDGATVRLSSCLVVEIKSSAARHDLDRALRRLGVAPVPMSKFAIGLSLLRPELPANRWHHLRNLIALGVGSVSSATSSGVIHRAQAPNAACPCGPET